MMFELNLYQLCFLENEYVNYLNAVFIELARGSAEVEVIYFWKFLTFLFDIYLQSSDWIQLVLLITAIG